MKWVTVLLILWSATTFGQIRVYMDDRKFSSDQVYEIDKNVVYRTNGMSTRIDFLYLEGGKVYLKERKFFTDVIYTISENKIFKGSSSSSFDMLYQLVDGKLYIGDSNSSSDCLYTFKDGIIYLGDSTSTFDAIMTYDAKPEEVILVAMLILPY